MVQSLHRHLRRQDGTEAGAGEGRDTVVHAAGAGRSDAIEADSRLHPREVEGARIEPDDARQPRRRGARSDGRPDAQTSAAQRCAGVPHPATAARPQVSTPSRTAVHGGDRPRGVRSGLQTHEGAAALVAAARDEEGDPVCLRSVSRRRTARRTAVTRAHRGRSRCGVPYLRRARHRRVDSPDHESEQPRRVQHRLLLFVARAPARLSLHRPADVRRAQGPRLARGMALRPGSPCRARAGRGPGIFRGAALASGDAREAEAPARRLRRDRRITGLQLAPVCPGRPACWPASTCPTATAR